MSAYDVVVLGGGPAGTAAGLTLLKRPGVSVAVVEASAYEAPRPGESLTPGARPLLDYLGLWDAFQRQNARDAFGSRAAWGQDALGELDYLFTIHGTGWGLDRVAFDRMLADAFRTRGGTLLARTHFADAERGEDGTWTVRLDGATRGPIRARFLIDATGRRSRLAKRMGVVREVHDRLVGVGGIAALASGRPVEAAVVVEAQPYGWWYTAPVPGGLAVVLMSDADVVSRMRAHDPEVWSRLLEGTRHTRDRMRDARRLAEPDAFAAHTSRLARAGGEGWVAVGDAVAAHDPLSSTGIPHALGSGVHGALVAADALFASGDLLAAYDGGVRADFGQYLDTHRQYYRREGRWPDEPFWARRRTRIHLDPRAHVTGVSDELTRDPIHLSPARAAALRARCRPGRPVHEAVRAFADAYPDVPHARAILGAQELVETGAIQLAPRAEPVLT